MDYEPVPKRRRTASPPSLREADSNIQPPHIPPQNARPPGGQDDNTYQLSLERAFADPRFRATLAQIFDKYDGKSAQPGEAINPSLCALSTGDSNLVAPAIDAHLDGPMLTDNLPYHTGAQQCGPGDSATEALDYQSGRSGETPGPYAPGGAPPGYMPAFPSGVHPGLMQNWYGNPFQDPGSYPSQWDGFSGQFTMPNEPTMPNGPWITPENFAYNAATWPPQAMQPPLAPCQIDPALEPAQAIQKMIQEDESTDNCQPEMEIYFDALGRKRRRRPMQPRFSKNGKRLGRPPKAAEALGVAGDIGAYDGEGEGEGECGETGGLVDLKPPDDEFGDEDDDALWTELADALRLASQATSKKRNRNSTKQPPKGDASATESDGAAEMDKDPGQAETMLRKIQQELIDRAVRRSTMAKEPGDDTETTAEGRRRSGRERKPANFGEQVSWEKVSAERRTSYKIKMHLRALSVQARRERKKKEKEEAELAAKEKEAAEKAKKEKEDAEKAEEEKQEAEERAAAAAAAAEKGAADESGEVMPSTIPDSQDTVTSLPIRTTPKKPQSNQIMRQTIKNHVNSVVHFEEDDEGLSGDEALVAFPIKNPVFSFKKPEKQVHSFLGENYIDTVYALSDDEAPALLASLKRVSLSGKKRKALVPAATARPKETGNASRQHFSKADKQPATAEGLEQTVRKELSPSTHIDTNTQLDPATEKVEATQVPPSCKPVEPEEAARPSMPTGGDGDDSGIDIRSEQASSDQAERPPARTSTAAEPLFQDHNLLGAADILDSLDVMSETEDTPSSPVSHYNSAKEDRQKNEVATASANDAPISSGMSDKPLFVDEEPMYESMDIFDDVAADIPLMGEEAEMEYNQPVEPTIEVFEQDTAKDKPIEEEPKRGPPRTEYEFSNVVFAGPVLDEFDIDAEEEAPPFRPDNIAVLPPARHPLPLQSKSRRHENRKSISSLTSKTSTPKATSKEPSPSGTGERPRLSISSLTSKTSTPKAPSKEPSPSSTGERPRLSSSSSSRTLASDSKASGARKASSSSRRSLLSLIGGGEDDIETLIKGKPTAPAPKSTPAVTPASSSSSSRKPSTSSSRNSSSHRKSKPPSSLTRLSLGSMSSPSRDKPGPSKERREAKDRRRKSAGAASSTSAPAEQQGTCGVDGYTCGRDFCFTCL